VRELRWHGKLRRESRPEVEVEVRGNAKLYERRRHLYLHTIDQLYMKNSADLQRCILLRDKLVTNLVIRATEGFNLHCNKVARQVEEKCCPYYRTFRELKQTTSTTATGTLLNKRFNPMNTKFSPKNNAFNRLVRFFGCHDAKQAKVLLRKLLFLPKGEIFRGLRTKLSSIPIPGVRISQICH